LYSTRPSPKSTLFPYTTLFRSNKAYELLPPTPAQTGRITKWAAAHFLAKVYLFRASELYSEWNSTTRDADLEQAVYYAEQVINRSEEHTSELQSRENLVCRLLL